MKNNDTNKVIEQILFENGIVADMENTDDSLPMDSIMFVSLIISIEDFFDIKIPIEMLQYEKWKSIKLILNNIKELIDEADAK